MRVREIVSASTDGNIELSRKIGPLWVSAGVGDWIQTDKIIESIAELAGVDHFVFVDSSKWVTNHVSDTVEGGLERSLVTSMETIDDIGGILNLDSTKLDVLAGCDVNDTEFWAVLFDALGIESHLVRIDNSIGGFEAHHELTRCSLVSVKHTDVFDSLRQEKGDAVRTLVAQNAIQSV